MLVNTFETRILYNTKLRHKAAEEKVQWWTGSKYGTTSLKGYKDKII